MAVAGVVIILFFDVGESDRFAFFAADLDSVDGRAEHAERVDLLYGDAGPAG